MHSWLINLLGIIACIAFIALGIVYFLYFERIVKWVYRKHVSIFKGAPWIKFMGKGKNDDEILNNFYNSWKYQGLVIPILIIARIMGIICALAGTYGLIRIVVYWIFKI